MGFSRDASGLVGGWGGRTIADGVVSTTGWNGMGGSGSTEEVLGEDMDKEGVGVELEVTIDLGAGGSALAGVGSPTGVAVQGTSWGLVYAGSSYGSDTQTNPHGY